ncbi:purine nucleoside permease like protein [Zymoseptoria brevis]|uniref:Purine nucleoside permease like protein n=1 Tax=Zymoseptoria brevis TaxID=1047168 RepID=A0A0F4GLN4_9PEZI|nr:purine nucleoside permease like protein [Zymoseptoria brevis]
MKLSLLSCLLVSQALASSMPAIYSGIKPKRGASRDAAAVYHQRRASNQAATECNLTLPIAPKIVIISMFTPEANTWHHRPDFDLLAHNISLPGLSPLFPDIHCDDTGSICQVVTGEGEINAAASINALWLSSSFNLTSSYFLIAGIGGVNPSLATTGSVSFARYAVQLDLQYQISLSKDAANTSIATIPQGSDFASEYPQDLYGTEVFELNNKLKSVAVSLARQAVLDDTTAAQAYRAKYPSPPANAAPSVVECDSGTSNTYWSGAVLGDTFSAYTKLLTNGSGVYCNSQQEDNATLEALLRGAIAEKLDFSRIILMRTASDFDRAPPDETEQEHLLTAEQAGFGPSIENIWLAGREIVQDVVGKWDEVYEQGVKAENYVGDLGESLDGTAMRDIGLLA